MAEKIVRATNGAVTHKDLFGSHSSAADSTEVGGGALRGVPSGFIAQDKMFGTYRPGTLTGLASRPGMGKTSKALADALHIADAGAHVVYFSLESAAIHVNAMMLSSVSRVDVGVAYELMSRLRDESSVDEDSMPTGAADRLLSGLDRLRKLPIHIDDVATTVEQIGAKVRRAQAALVGAERVGLVVIDRAELVATERRETREVEFDEVIRGLLRLAKDHGVPVLVLTTIPAGDEDSPAGRIDDRPNCRPTLSDLRERDAVAQHASRVFFCYRDEEYVRNTMDAGTMELICAKNRGGPRGAIKLAWVGKYASVTNCRP